MKDIKKYDNRLLIEKKLDGSIEICRKGVLSKRKNSIINFYNQYQGSMLWILEKIKSMDSTRHDFFTPVIQDGINRRRNKRSDDRMHRDVADFIRNGTQFVG